MKEEKNKKTVCVRAYKRNFVLLPLAMGKVFFCVCVCCTLNAFAYVVATHFHNDMLVCIIGELDYLFCFRNLPAQKKTVFFSLTHSRSLYIFLFFICEHCDLMRLQNNRSINFFHHSMVLYRILVDECVSEKRKYKITLKVE